MPKPTIVDYHDYEVFHDINGDLQVQVHHSVSEENPYGIWTARPVVNRKSGRNLGDGRQRTAPQIYAANTLTTFTDGTLYTGLWMPLAPEIETALLRIMQEQEL